MNTLYLLLTVVLIASVGWTWYVTHLVLQEVRWFKRVIIPWMNGLSHKIDSKG